MATQESVGIIFEFAQGSARKVYIKFPNEQASSKAMRSPYLRRQNSWVHIEKR